MKVNKCFSSAALLVFALLIFGTAGQAQEPQQSTQTVGLSAEDIDALDRHLAEIEADREDAVVTAARIDDAEDFARDVLEQRLLEDRLDTVEKTLAFAHLLLELGEQGSDISPYRDIALEELSRLQTGFIQIWERIDALYHLPDPSLETRQLAAAYAIYFDMHELQARLLPRMAETLNLQESFGVDIAEQRSAYISMLEEFALEASVSLHLAQEDLDGIRAARAAFPDDVELRGRVFIAEDRVNRTAGHLELIVTALDTQGEDVGEYRQQLVVATGSIVPEDLDRDVLGGLARSAWESVRSAVAERGAGSLFKLLLFFVLVYLFYRLSGLVRRVVAAALQRSHTGMSQLLNRLVIASAGNLVLVFGVLVALSQVGISLGPVLAGLGILGFIVGFALQDTLSNFASGLMILFTKPYDVGDVVDLGGTLGHVEHMSLVNTTIHTFDNQRVILPNSMVWGGVIKNVTAQKERRVDMVFGISYADDIDKAEAILEEIVRSHDLVLAEPEPVVRLHELADSSVNFVVRPWAATENYWTVYWDVTKAVKQRFDREGISIPFPQRDVHLYQQPQ